MVVYYVSIISVFILCNNIGDNTLIINTGTYYIHILYILYIILLPIIAYTVKNHTDDVHHNIHKHYFILLLLISHNNNIDKYIII